MIHGGRILLATDLSPDSALALEMAKEVARHFGSDLVMLHVDEGAEVAPLSEVAARRRERARCQLARASEELGREQISASALIRSGDPAREILHIARTQGVGLIVIATHGWSRSKNLLLGSVADRILRHAGVPVLIVRHPDRVVPPQGRPFSAATLLA